MELRCQTRYEITVKLVEEKVVIEREWKEVEVPQHLTPIGAHPDTWFTYVYAPVTRRESSDIFSAIVLNLDLPTLVRSIYGGRP